MKKGTYRGIGTLLCFIFCFMIFSGTCFAQADPYAISAQASDNIHQTDLFLVLDNSRSMLETDPNKLLSSFAEAFYTAAPSGSSTLGVVTYSGEVETVTKPQVSTDDRGSLGDLGYTQQGKGTDIGAALNRAADELTGVLGDAGENPHKAIVLVTDGDPDGKSSPYIAKSANGRVIPVYCIYINDGQNDKQDKCRQMLEGIAQDTGVDKIYEVKDAADIDQVVGEIVSAIYNYTDNSQPIEISDEADVTCTVGDNIYEMICNIKYSNALELSITAPSGAKIYDAGTSYSPMLHVTNDHSPAVVNLLWPEAGDYVFHLSVEEAQTCTFNLVEISAGVDLTLSSSRIQKGKTLQASCPLIGNSNAVVTNSVLRIYDSADSEVMESAGSDAISPNQQGGFDIDTAQLSTGDYNAVAISTLDNGDMLASVKVPFTVIDKPFPWYLVIIAGVVLLLIAALIIALKIRSSSPGMVNPERCQIRTKVLSKGGGNWEQICFVDLPMPHSLPNGKTRDAYSLVKREMEIRGMDTELLPKQLENLYLSYWVRKRSNPRENGYFVVQIGQEKNAANAQLTRRSPFSHTFDNTVRIEMMYTK